MIIPVQDDELLRIMNQSLDGSGPGDAIHHLYVGKGKLGPLGMTGHTFDVVGIAPVGPIDVDDFIFKSILASAIQAAKEAPILFLILQLEITAVDTTDADEERHARVRWHAEQRRLEEVKEELSELSQLYAVAADGRRWSGYKVVSGPRVGEREGPVLHRAGERAAGDYWKFSPLLRKCVGIKW